MREEHGTSYINLQFAFGEDGPLLSVCSGPMEIGSRQYRRWMSEVMAGLRVLDEPKGIIHRDFIILDKPPDDNEYPIGATSEYILEIVSRELTEFLTPMPRP